MKRLVKLLGLLGGVAAVVWAMRDRFISVAIPREPEIPKFKPSGAAASARSVDAIEGVGPVFLQRLISGGLGTVEKLADATPDIVAEKAGVSTSRARNWIEQAKSLT